MKNKQAIILLLLLITAMTGCGKTADLGDTYIEGSDFQYMYMDEWARVRQQKSKEGYFFLMQHYIYYLDDETQKLLPLCNKADCLHDRETDVNRFADCNAFLFANEFGERISYYNGWLYYLDNDLRTKDSQSVLYRLKADGSKKEEVYRWEKDVVSAWCLHRGLVYYVEKTYWEREDSGVEEKFALKMFPAEGKKELEIVYEPEENLTVYTIDWLQAYGNHLYFVIHAVKTKNLDEITEENYMEYEYFKQWHYDILRDELTEVTVPDAKPDEGVSMVGFWRNQLVIPCYRETQQLGAPGKVYLANLDGTEPELLFEGVRQGLNYYSDGKYLYVSNMNMIEEGIEDKQYYEVYDEDLKLVDTLRMPFSSANDVEIGQPDGLYFFMERDDGTGVYLEYFDKSAIGSCNGEPFPITQVTELDYSPAEMAMQSGEGWYFDD